MDKRVRTFEIEEQVRGNVNILIITQDYTPRGSIEIHSYAEKVAWLKGLEEVNRSILELSQTK